MDKNNIIGFVLIAAFLIGFSWWNQPSEEEQRKAYVEDSIANVKKSEAAKTAKLANVQKSMEQRDSVLKDTSALLYHALNGKAQKIVLKNKNVELTLNTKGGTIVKAVIKNRRGHNLAVKDGSKDSKDLTLFDSKDQKLQFALEAKETNILTGDLFFTPSNVTDSTVTMTAKAGNGKSIVFDYVLGKDYMLHMKFFVKGMNGLFSPGYNAMDVDWKDNCRQQERGFTFENRYATLTYHNVDGGTDNLSETSEKIDEKIEAPIDWVAFKNQFFSAVIIAKNDFHKDALLTSIPTEKGTGYLKSYQAKMKTFFDPSGSKPSEFDFYYGPNDFRLLQKVEKESTFGKDLQMQKLVYLGIPIFRLINRWFTLYVFDWLSKMGLSMGVVLILLTLLLKFITYPMVKKSYMSSAKMRVLRPKLDAATAQFSKPEDQMQKQQAMMAEYSKYGVSPLSGCLPMLIQMPIWLAMFNFVPNAIQLRDQSFLWIHDLGTIDPIFEWGSSIWLIGDHISLTSILFVISNILYSWFTMQQQKDQMVGQADQMKMMQWMMYIMPLFFFFVFNDYSAGLNFYYFISLLFSAIIMWVLRKTTNDEKLLQILEARYNENKDNPKKVSGLAARLQAMQQMQKQQQEEMRNKRANLNNKKNNLGK